MSKRGEFRKSIDTTQTTQSSETADATEAAETPAASKTAGTSRDGILLAGLNWHLAHAA